MRILILPDVHQKIDRVKKILEQYSVDLIVSLGDWFDDFHDTPQMAAATAEYLLELYKTYGDRFIWCLGNHDIPYVFPDLYQNHRCSGVSAQKLAAISCVFDGKLDDTKLRLHYVVEGDFPPIVLSHAGIHKFHLDVDAPTLDVINDTCRIVLEDCLRGLDSPFLHAGRGRGGKYPVGGITWLDWRQEYVPIRGITQIVGHTPLRYPEVRLGYNKYSPELGADVEPTSVDHANSCVMYQLCKGKELSINLDTNLRHFGIIDTDPELPRLHIYEYEQYD